MEPPETNHQFSFLQGGGETGELTRNYNWSASPVGEPAAWPQSLRTTLGLLLHSAFPTFLVWGRETLICFYNDAYRLSLGTQGVHPAIGKSYPDVFPEVWDFVGPLFQQVLDTGQAAYFENQLVPIERNGKLDDVYWTFSYSPAFDDDGSINGVFVTCLETTGAVIARKKSEESQQQILAFFEQSPVGIAIISKDNLIFRMANPFYGYLVGRTPDQIVGKSLLEALPELQGQGFDDLLREVIATGKPFIATEVAVDIVRNNGLETIYVDLAYQPQLESDGSVSGILVVATDVTQQVLARRKIEDSEARQRAIISAVPAAMVLFVGRELIVEMPSQNFIDIIDRGPDVTGKPLGELMPELESQSFLQILDEVYTSGEPFSVFGTQVDITQQDGSVTHDFFNLIYTPLFNTTGQVYAILSVATNVTDIIKARQALEDAQVSLQGAVELAQLAMWRLNIKEGTYWYSERFMNWLGFSEDTKRLDEAYNPLPDDYRKSVVEAISAAIQRGPTGLYQNEHPIINRLTGQQRIIQVQGQVTYDEAGNPLTLGGTAHDVTQQRQLQLALEQLVQQRTEELETTNEELAATNEELAATSEEVAATNEELTEANQNLTRSNRNLEQFAYIASHDLQEPLRKIQSFGDLLKSRYADQLEDGVDYVNRMQSAASRMSTLVRDLLTFSRISTQRDVNAWVNLPELVQNILTDLELRIKETGALVRIDDLPTVYGDPMQLGQLFQNLLSNALKFHRADTIPHIHVSAQLLAVKELPTSLKPARSVTAYHRIDVSDNGIGFDEKYVDRIFQVFQRLHGKNEFAGTGIGLAICEKVVTNHGGAISASSQPGQGATFSIYLPA